ncbi:MAG: DivIVA domain-containing protein [Deltaproteobacteria bacterium]|nr:DivIVA domain-containing protein [Deltaproteobacteria bacterium]
MKITPLDIQQQRFRTGWRGLDRAEVDAFLNLVASEFEALIRENHDLKEELRRARNLIDQFREREQALKDTMITAQKITEDIKHAARKDAEIVVGQAELEAEKILQNAHSRLITIIDDIHELKRQRALLRENLRSVLDTHHKLLEVHKEEELETRAIEDKLKALPRKGPRPVETEPAPATDPQNSPRRGAG